MDTETRIVDPMQHRVNAAMRLAKTVAGGDEARVVQAFHAAINAMDAVDAQATAVEPRPATPGAARTTVTRGIRGAVRTAPSPAPAAPLADIPQDSVYSDPTFLANAMWVASARTRIVGGVPVSGFPDCVAVGAGDRWCCTGTLVAPHLVVTAAHCIGGCDSRAFVGTDVEKPEQGRVIKVRDRAVHPAYRTRNPHGDLAVLILDETIDDVAPREIASASSLSGQRSVRVVGYGTTDVYGSTGYGIRRLVDVPLATNDPRFGSDPQTEFVAGAPFLDRDSCSGDSGGPAYVLRGSQWQLAGATSRATASAFRTCGDGGVYTLVPAYQDWLQPFLAGTNG